MLCNHLLNVNIYNRKQQKFHLDSFTCESEFCLCTGMHTNPLFRTYCGLSDFSACHER